MKVRMHDSLPSTELAWLASAGLEDDASGELIVAWFDGQQSRSLPSSHDNEEPLPVVALVPDAAQVDPAIQAGATDAIVGHPDTTELLARLTSHRRIARLWRRRMQAQQRRAQRAMAELASTQDLLGRLIDATPNPVMAVDKRGRVLVFNRAAETSLGYDAEYARTHMHVTDVYADAGDARRVLAEMRATQSGMVQGLAVRLRARWGEQIPVELSAAEVHDAEGELIATVGVFEDMREQVALKNRLEATTEQLIAAEQRASAIELAGEAAYEINQPLTALMGTLELLEMEQGLPERAKARLERAQGHVQRIRDAVRSLARTGRNRAASGGGSGSGGGGGNRMSELISGRE